MYFTSRLDLGKKLALRVPDLKNKEPIVLCLKESALSTSIAIATDLHGWVYPLLIEPVIIPGDPRIIGAINQDGQLCYNPELSTYEREDLQMEYQGIIQDASREAFSKLNRRVNDYGELRKDGLHGRTIILCADILRGQLEIGAASEFLKSIAVTRTIALVGNITTDIADALSIATDKNDYLDVMTSMFDDDHYFEQLDGYTIEEERQLAMNVSHYWI